MSSPLKKGDLIRFTDRESWVWDSSWGSVCCYNKMGIIIEIGMGLYSVHVPFYDFIKGFSIEELERISQNRKNPK